MKSKDVQDLFTSLAGGTSGRYTLFAIYTYFILIMNPGCSHPKNVSQVHRAETCTVEYTQLKPCQRRLAASCLNCWIIELTIIKNSGTKKQVNVSAGFRPISAMLRRTGQLSDFSQSLAMNFFDSAFPVSTQGTCSVKDVTCPSPACNYLLDIASLLASSSGAETESLNLVNSSTIPSYVACSSFAAAWKVTTPSDTD